MPQRTADHSGRNMQRIAKNVAFYAFGCRGSLLNDGQALSDCAGLGCRIFLNAHTRITTTAQAQLVYEAGQIKGSIAMSHPDRLHSGKPGDEQARHLCYGGAGSNSSAEHLLEMVRRRHLALERGCLRVSHRQSSSCSQRPAGGCTR